MPVELMIEWNDWAEYRDRNNLKVEEVIMLENAQTVIVVNSPTGDLPMPDTYKQSKLSPMLKTLYDNAINNQGEVQRRELSSGLRIDFIYGKDGAYRIQLSRTGVFPSETEWNTVINHFPENSPMLTIPPQPVDRIKYQGRCFLRSAWEVK